MKNLLLLLEILRYGFVVFFQRCDRFFCIRQVSLTGLRGTLYFFPYLIGVLSKLPRRFFESMMIFNDTFEIVASKLEKIGEIRYIIYERRLLPFKNFLVRIRCVEFDEVNHLDFTG